jgi:hypothetical protein
MRIHTAFLLGSLLVLVLLLTGCATYRVPGGAADFRALGITADEQAEMTEDSIARQLAKRPAASFPTSIAAVRVQARGYRSYTTQGYDYGRYSVVGVREVETEEGLSTLSNLPMVRTVIPLNRLVIHGIEKEEDLRQAAARVQADMTLIYTFDTKFGVESTIPALGVITLGLFPNDEARVTSTASAALIDTRTGFIYALAEATADTRQIANAWTSKDAVDQSRRRAEREAFEGLVSELTKAWKQVAETYAVPPTAEAINDE